MPYRGAIGPRIACAAHAAAEAIGSCTRCHTPLCDPCTLYFAADPLCRRCVGAARRRSMARIVAGVAAVMLTMTLATVVMLAAIPAHVRMSTAVAPPPVRHVENCRPFDRWLAEARHDITRGRPHVALHDLALSRRDCAADPDRELIEALAYDRIGDKFAAIAAAVRYRDAMQALGALPDPQADEVLREYDVKIAPIAAGEFSVGQRNPRATH